MLAYPLPSCINKCVSTKAVNTGCIDAFGIRFGASIMIANEFSIAMLGLNALRHFERRLLQKPSTMAKLALALLRLSNRTKFTMAMCYWQFHKNEFLEVTVNE